MATVQRQTPPTYRTGTTGRHGDPFPGEKPQAWLAEPEAEPDSGAVETHLVLVSVDGGVAHRPPEARHRPGLSTTASTHSGRISEQTGSTESGGRGLASHHS